MGAGEAFGPGNHHVDRGRVAPTPSPFHTPADQSSTACRKSQARPLGRSKHMEDYSKSLKSSSARIRLSARRDRCPPLSSDKDCFQTVPNATRTSRPSKKVPPSGGSSFAIVPDEKWYVCGYQNYTQVKYEVAQKQSSCGTSHPSNRQDQDSRSTSPGVCSIKKSCRDRSTELLKQEYSTEDSNRPPCSSHGSKTEVASGHSVSQRWMESWRRAEDRTATGDDGRLQNSSDGLWSSQWLRKDMTVAEAGNWQQQHRGSQIRGSCGRQ
ncbi:hypothetical protein U9M48_016821 [Paspalum notatum var. saurae]|uniref:Uncharacterized protein n=1 Tax=Paspalum notatum var. saurae TaxID=547442 RepID=A0AAQ3T6B0_PASNO